MRGCSPEYQGTPKNYTATKKSFLLRLCNLVALGSTYWETKKTMTSTKKDIENGRNSIVVVQIAVCVVGGSCHLLHCQRKTW